MSRSTPILARHEFFSFLRLKYYSLSFSSVAAAFPLFQTLTNWNTQLLDLHTNTLWPNPYTATGNHFSPSHLLSYVLFGDNDNVLLLQLSESVALELTFFFLFFLKELILKWRFPFLVAGFGSSCHVMCCGLMHMCDVCVCFTCLRVLVCACVFLPPPNTHLFYSY